MSSRRPDERQVFVPFVPTSVSSAYCFLRVSVPLTGPRQVEPLNGIEICVSVIVAVPESEIAQVPVAPPVETPDADQVIDVPEIVP